MKPSSLLKTAILMGGVAMIASGCVVREQVAYRPPPPAVVPEPAPAGEVVVGEPPPPAPGVIENVTIAPDPTFVWIGGAWFWEGRWVWHPGHWGRPPFAHAVWVGPHYVNRGGRHVWVRGYWRR